ncbi:MAG: hypothetical protein JXR25_07505 [Pontiellaceae bacterium]|nr:hypothetical protein [Pontiellaceae bacterium]MBN2784658.1 hypothetical protein [Pontiellaceae bacterium]
MSIKRGLFVVAVITASVLVQGCALVYVQDSDVDETSTVREVGVLGGCIPIFSYRTHRSEKTEPIPFGNSGSDDEPEEDAYY